MSSYAVSSAQPVEPVVEESSPSRDSPPRATSAMSHYHSSPSRMSYGSSAGRPLVQEPKSTEPRTIPIRKNISPTRVFSRPISVSPNAAYRESDQRRLEKEEARSLRDALEEMDLHDDVRLHQAAQDEATELVWMHQNPGVPYKNPGAPYRNPDMDKLSQSPEKNNRSPSQYRGFRKNFMSSPRRNSRHSASDTSSDGHYGLGLEDSPGKQSQSESNEGGSSPKRNSLFRKNLKVNFALPSDETSSTPTVDSNKTETRTSGSETSKGIFRDPNDRIYEEPDESQTNATDTRPDFSRSDSSALRNRPRNVFPRGSRPLPGRLGSLSLMDKLAKFDLHRNSQTQSRNPEYTVNEPVTQTGSGAKESEEESPPTKNGLEIRSDEIRAATSKRRTDRSSNLPMPTAVSDRTGRPIVSFDPTWKPTEAQSPSRNRDSLRSRESSSPTPPRETAAPTIQVSDAPTIQVSEAPSIQVSEAPSIPVINLPDDKEPTISEMEAVQAGTNGRPLPEPTKNSTQRSTSPPKKQPAVSQDRWYTPYTRSGVPTARCESCTLPIAGKIVTAAGSRFHPECFVCSHCQTPLECIGFYQEPEAKRNERLAQTPAHDEEARAIRFYCHLDFHELFSPRCKSCKTPIEGEVVVACGAEWHVGHFFCAECGDVSPLSLSLSWYHPFARYDLSH